jgi:HlyD family secretion protein
VKGKKFLPLILLLTLALFVAACGSAEAPEAAPKEEAATPVEVATAETGDIALIFSYAGDLQAKDSVTVLPGAGGRIESVLVEVGDEVKAGDSIALIESDIYAAQLKQAEIGLANAKLNLAKMEEGARPEQVAAAQAAVELARASLNDVTTLSPDERAVAVANIEQAQTNLKALTTVSDDERTVAASNLAQAEAGLRLAQAEYDKIAWAGQAGMTPQALQLQQATIAYETALAAYNLQTNPNEFQLEQAQIAYDTARAAYNLQANPSDAQLAPLMSQLVQAELNLALTERPFTDSDFEQARIGIKQAETALELAQLQLDETTIRAPFDGVIAELYVTKGSSVGPGAPVTLVVSDVLEVMVNIEENRISQIFTGQPAALRVTAYPGQDFPAVVTSIAPIADSSTHTFAVKVTPVDEQGLLRAGMFTNLAILAEEKQNTLIVPRSAVTVINGQETVYVINGDVAEQRPVTTGLFEPERIEIVSGLEVGETVVIAGQRDLIDGAKVEIVDSF